MAVAIAARDTPSRLAKAVAVATFAIALSTAIFETLFIEENYSDNRAAMQAELAGPSP